MHILRFKWRQRDDKSRLRIFPKRRTVWHEERAARRSRWTQNKSLAWAEEDSDESRGFWQSFTAQRGVKKRKTNVFSPILGVPRQSTTEQHQSGRSGVSTQLVSSCRSGLSWKLAAKPSQYEDIFGLDGSTGMQRYDLVCQLENQRRCMTRSKAHAQSRIQPSPTCWFVGLPIS